MSIFSALPVFALADNLHVVIIRFHDTFRHIADRFIGEIGLGRAAAFAEHIYIKIFKLAEMHILFITHAAVIDVCVIFIYPLDSGVVKAYHRRVFWKLALRYEPLNALARMYSNFHTPDAGLCLFPYVKFGKKRRNALKPFVFRKPLSELPLNLLIFVFIKIAPIFVLLQFDIFRVRAPL